MVDAIDRGKDAPPELVLYWNCKRYSALPDQGAMFDQDWALINRMALLDGLYSSYVSYRGAVGKQIHSLPGWVTHNIAYLQAQGFNIGLVE